MENVIITGSHGFIGSNIKNFLSRNGYNVIPMYQDTIADLTKMYIFFVENKPDSLINCGSYGNMANHDIEYKIIEANINQVFNILYMMKGLPLKGFINFSSSSVTLPHTTMYSASKRAGEEICKAFVNKYKMPIVSVRPSTIIGPSEQSAHLIPTLINSALSKKQMPYVGYPTHDYVDVRDVSSAIELLLPQCNNLKGQIIDIASGSAVSNDAVRFIVEDITKSKVPVKHVKNMRAYDVPNWHGNPMVLEGLGWKRKYSLRDSIKDMVDYESLRTN